MLKPILNYLGTKFNKEDGMEMLQVLLISGLTLVIIVVVFYPQVQKFFEDMMGTITGWFTKTGSEPFK